MKLLRILTLIIFVIVACAFLLTFYKVRSGLDPTRPVITVPESKIDVDVNVTEEDLLEGVTAYDEKDGDLTDKIIIQDISKFVDDSTSIVTYVVCDSDNNLGKATQRIHYVNYSHPKLKLFSPLLFPTSSNISLRSVIGADDVIDGDISGNVMVNLSNVDNTKDGIYTTNVSVFNSKGDLVSFDLPVKVYTVNKKQNCTINLNTFLTYIKTGEEFNPLNYVQSVVDENGTPTGVMPVAEGYVDVNTPGGYAIYFSMPEWSGLVANSALTVIVTE